MSTNDQETYLVAASKWWNRRLFDDVICHFHGNWCFIDNSQELNVEYLKMCKPVKIFFLHWSSKVPAEIVEQYECICFHMTDVPYGRGGSPLQNLIARGHKRTKLTALRMVKQLDAGPVYLKSDLDLSTGRAEEIFIQASKQAADMIKIIIENNPKPEPQKGKVVNFARRTPDQSRIATDADILQIYDVIRMLDAEGYPKAFIEQDSQRYEFSNARLENGKVKADVCITINKREIR